MDAFLFSFPFHEIFVKRKRKKNSKKYSIYENLFRIIILNRIRLNHSNLILITNILITNILFFKKMNSFSKNNEFDNRKKYIRIEYIEK